MKYKLQDLIDIEHFQNLQDRLNEIYSFPSSIIDNDGNILTATAWQDICTKFHRKNTECEKLCIKSDQYIKDHLHEANPAVSYCCPHGLVDNAAPIIIDGIHYGNFFTGQFFLEEPDIEFFRAQANKYGFDEDAYLDAVKKVPIWTKEQLNSYLFFIKGLIAVISESGLKTLKEIENRKLIEESKKRYESILKSAMDGYWITNTEGKLIEVNDTYCSMSGYSEDELLMMQISDLEAAEDHQLVTEHMKKVISQGSDRFVTKHRRKDGSVFDVEVSVQFRPEENGQCVCFLRDISDRRLAEENLEKERELFKTIVDQIPVMLTRYDPEANMLLLNREFERLVGWKTEEVQDIDLMEKVYPDPKYRQEAYEYMQKATKEWKEYRVQSKSGNIIESEWSNIRLDDGTQIGIGIDVTERKKVEASLRASEERFKVLFNYAPLPYQSLDENGKIIEVNMRWLEMLGYSRDEVIGKPFSDFLHPDWVDHFKENFPRFKSIGEVLGVEFELRKKDGNFLWTTFHGKIRRDDQGAFIQTHCVFNDITEQRRLEKKIKQQEEALRQAQKMKAIGTLAGGIAHDFNNILGIIVGNAELAMFDIPEWNPAQESLKEIREASLRARDLITQILLFARQKEHKLSNIRVEPIAKESLKMLRASIPTTVGIKQEIQKDLPAVLADAAQIQQIIMNLCTNAGQVMEAEGGTLILKLDLAELNASMDTHSGHIPKGRYVRVQVQDTGPGISSENRERIFEPFFTTKGVGEGTGLGLAVVHGIVQDRQGGIVVESEEGKGTIFTVYLPASEEKPFDESKEEKSELPKGHERILFVDDEPMIMKLGQRMLERQGYEVETRASGTDALVCFRQDPNRFDLVVTDMTMPGLRGDHLAEELLKIRPDIPVILSTGFSKQISEEKAEELGIRAFVMKPLTAQDLANTVRKVLDEMQS